jgi:hypothetical protein
MSGKNQSRTLIFLVIVAVTTLYLLGSSIGDRRGQIIGRDFVNIWVTSSLIRDHRFSEIYDNNKYNQAVEEITQEELALHAYSYPPNSFWLIVPFSDLPYIYSFILWSCIGLLIYMFACGAPDWDRMKMFALVLAPTTFLNLNYGQNGLISTALIVGGFTLLRKRPVMAGICFGLLSYKPTLGILIPIALLIGRNWIPFISASLVTVATVLLSIKIAGFDIWQSFFEHSVPFSRSLIERGSGPLMHMMPTPVMTARLLGLETSTGYWIQSIFALYGIAGVVWAFSKDGPRELLFASVLVGTFLVTPYVHNYDMALISVALILLFGYSEEEGFLFGEKIIIGIAWTLPLIMLILPVAPAIIVTVFTMLLIKINNARKQSLDYR